MNPVKQTRCAVYTRKSSEEGLEQSFNSLHAQREACEAYILSQRHEGWEAIATPYDDGGFSGGSMERPALRKLLDDIAMKRVDTVVVYKVDRLTRSLMDFAKIVDQFDKQGISFVSVTQQFNTTTSMGRLTLNVLLSFAQFEREVTGERIRDKIAASKRKGMWMGGVVPIGYDLQDRHLLINPVEAERVREVYLLYIKLGCISKLQVHLERIGVRSKERLSRTGRASGGVIYSRGALYDMLHNRIYLGEITHKELSYPGQQSAIIERSLWDQVQTQFQANLQAPRTRPRTTSPSLLTGLLFDERGNRFTPSHSAKKGKRYRYYVSQVVIKNGPSNAQGPVRIPAQEIEDLVLAQIHSLLGSPQRLLDLLVPIADDPLRAEEIVHASREWATKAPDAVRDVMRSIVSLIVLAESAIKIHCGARAVQAALGGHLETQDSEMDSQIEDTIILEAPVQCKRFGGEVRLLLPPDATADKQNTVPSLVRAVVRAHGWANQMLKGEVANQRAIAGMTGLDERYVSKLMPLAFLAPDITEAILEGRQPVHLTLDECLKSVSMDWNQQRRALLFSR